MADEKEDVPLMASIIRISVNLILIALIAAASGLGLLEMVGTGAPWQMPVFLLAALIVTVAITYALRRASTRFAPIWQRLLAGLVALALISVSIVLGFGYVWEMFEAREQAFDDTIDRLQVFNRELRVADSQLSGTRDILIVLKDEFVDRARLEAELGDQCGTVSAGGLGPRAVHLESRASEISDRVEELNAEIERIRLAWGGVQSRIDDVRDLASAGGLLDLEPADIKAIMRANEEATSAAMEMTALADGEVVRGAVEDFSQWAATYADPEYLREDPNTGARFICTNPNLARQLSRVSDEIATLPRVEPPPPVQQARTCSARIATMRLVNTVFFRSQAKASNTAAQAVLGKGSLRSDDLFPLGVVLALHFLLCLLNISGETRRGW
jgi:hypothetical protein